METRTPGDQLVEVRFVGGPVHARKVLMANPDLRIEMEQSSGESVVYCRRSVEASDGREVPIVFYAPDGMADHEFDRLVLDAGGRSGS